MTIAAAGGMLTIDVTNERHPRRGHSGGGHGLVGMQERAVSVGGHVDSGTDGTQFWIRAQLPADGEAPT
jgi:signal transduction histidine kinase